MLELIKPLGLSPLLREQVRSKALSKSAATISMDWVGICRTDIGVADGVIEAPHELILGHECSGRVIRDPSGRFKEGDWVAINPLLEGGSFMGLHVDGALCSRLDVDCKKLVDAQGVDPILAAYVEPVAASMAPMKAHISPGQKGVIYHAHRISELTYNILSSMGYNIDWIRHEPDGNEWEHYDYAIETSFEDQYITPMINALKPGGVLVVKSRQVQPRKIIPAQLVAKEITLQAVNYYDFDRAMDWIRNYPERVRALVGSVYVLEDWSQAFEEARGGEAKKVFIRVGEG